MTPAWIAGRGLVCALGPDLASAVCALRDGPPPPVRREVAGGFGWPFQAIADDEPDWTTRARRLVRATAGTLGGDRRGHDLGYPTANVELGDYQRPRYGIYAVRVTLDDGSERPGVASLGIRPTFQPPQELLEAYLFDFDGDLYGRKIEVALHAFIREEKKFDNLDALTAAMRGDEAQARRILA